MQLSANLESKTLGLPLGDALDWSLVKQEKDKMIYYLENHP